VRRKRELWLSKTASEVFGAGLCCSSKRRRGSSPRDFICFAGDQHFEYIEIGVEARAGVGISRSE
jgi:hypothetical protein